MKNAVYLGVVIIVSIFYLGASQTCASTPVSLRNFQKQWDGEWAESPDRGFLLTTSSADRPSLLEMSFAQPMDLTKKFFSIELKIEDVNNWGGIELRLSSDANYANYMGIGIPQFDDPNFNIVQSGSWVKYSFTPGHGYSVGAPDLAQVQKISLYVQSKGTDSMKLHLDNFEIHLAEIESVVSLTFDDGHDDPLPAAKIMKKYGLIGTAYIMPEEINDVNYLTVEQLQQLKQEYGWSISSHHKVPIIEHADVGASYDDITSALLEWGADEKEVLHFAYPLGKQDRKATLPITREKMLSARVAGGGAETLPPVDWHMLKTYNVTPDQTPEMIMERVAKARKYGEWLILMFHRFTDGEPENDLTYRYVDFERLCQLLSESEARIMPVDEVYNAFH